MALRAGKKLPVPSGYWRRDKSMTLRRWYGAAPIMVLVYLGSVFVMAGCTSSSRLANPLGLDFDPIINEVDSRRAVPVVYPAGAASGDAHDRQWQVISRGYPPYIYDGLAKSP